MKTPNIVNMEYGSRLYGTATPQSDTDYAGIYMPTMRELLLQRAGKGLSKSTGKDHVKNTADDVDSILFPLPRFIDLCLDGDTTALDMLHCDQPISSSWIWEELRSKRTAFYSKGMKAYVGYVRSQAIKYGIKGDKLKELHEAINFLRDNGALDMRLSELLDKVPTGEFLKVISERHVGGCNYWEVLGKRYQDTNSVAYVLSQLAKTYDSYGHRAKQASGNGGVDWKAVHHSLRVMYQVRAVFEHGDFRYPLEETPFLMRVKTGDANYLKEVAPEFDRFFETFDDLADKSGLPDKVDRLHWDNWLVGVYDEWFNITWKEV